MMLYRPMSEQRMRVLNAAIDGAKVLRRLANQADEPAEQKRLRKVALFYISIANRKRR